MDRALWNSLFTEAEQQSLKNHELGDLAATVAFSAKEAGYKAIHPLAKQFIPFHDAEIQIEANTQTFRISYLGSHTANQALERGQGYFSHCFDHVFTLFVIE